MKSIILRIVSIFCIALIAGNIFGHLMLIHNPQVSMDKDGFARLARQFATYGNFASSIRRGPIYPAFLALIYKLFGASHSNIIFFQAFLLGILGVSVFMISYENFLSKKIAFWTGICTILHPLCLWYVPMIWLELLFANLVMLVIWSAYKALSNSTCWNLFVFGVLTGIASLCKAVTLFFPLFLACSVFGLYIFKIMPFNRLSRITLLKIFVIPTSVMLLTIIPWTIRNHIVSDTFTLVSSNVGVEFFRGNVYAQENSFLLQKSIPEIWKIANEKEKEILRQERIEKPGATQDRIFNNMMIKYMFYQPIQFAVKILKQMPAFWMRGQTINKSFVFILLALSALVFFIKGFLVLREKSIFVHIVLFLIIYFNLLYAAILAWARYSMPVYPPMIVIGVYWIIQFGVVRKNSTNLSNQQNATAG